MSVFVNSEDLTRFRHKIREFCSQALPADIRGRVSLGAELGRADYMRWQKILAGPGWLCGHWPLEHGGLGWSARQRYIFDEETVRAGAPRLYPFSAACIGPVLYTFGSDAQKKQFLSGILAGSTWWCQGYSEPGAGSDLANLSTRAVLSGDHYIVNGQKTWTTTAHWADMMFALVRTSSAGTPQQGISFLLIDMKSPGITVRPIVTIDLRHHLNDVFFENVRVPSGNLIGAESTGWTYAKFLLRHERLSAAEIGKAKWRLDLLKRLIAHLIDAGASPDCQYRWRRMVAELNVQLLSLESVCLGFLDPQSSGEAPAGNASVIKILGSQLGQSLTRALLTIAGRKGLTFSDTALRDAPSDEEWWQAVIDGIVRDHLHERSTTLYGGTNEIQRNIIAKQELGL